MKRQAVVYVRPGRPLDENFAGRFWQHCMSRGYEFVALVRDWRMVQSMLGDGQANIVVLPTPDDEMDDGATVRLGTPPVGAVDAGETRDLQHRARRASGNRKSDDQIAPGRRKLTPEKVRMVLDAPEGSTTHHGIDPESIAAARRIAKHLTECNRRRV